ncbi:MAG: hypothetical protein HY220_00915 [Candidatus Sungbacteria bacterium]|uniref:Uncharacterized protein n=1 Tax=Candidatus Sungiibacteriota bacterium TaxID=2750080 RepID=A0A9D6LRC6_9BACT|nr:hypothetical protein [Candidatus Sungbacteria bacterium]
MPTVADLLRRIFRERGDGNAVSDEIAEFLGELQQITCAKLEAAGLSPDPEICSNLDDAAELTPSEYQELYVRFCEINPALHPSLT